MKYYARQGEVNFLELEDGDEFPSDLTAATPEGGNYILGHSETGHHHVLAVAGNTARVYDQDEFVSWIDNTSTDKVVAREGNVIHLRGFDTHDPVGLKPGKRYMVTRQREHTPEGFRRAAD